MFLLKIKTHKNIWKTFQIYIKQKNTLSFGACYAYFYWFCMLCLCKKIIAFDFLKFT